MPIFILGFVALCVYLVWLYNGLVMLRQRCGRAAADIEAQLRQRQDLVPNLVAAVSGYAAHERGTLEDVMRARGAFGAASTGQERAHAEAELAHSLWRLFALAENYPTLKASRNFALLQGELADIEYRLTSTRFALNAAIADYNVALQQFPANIVAGSFGFHALDMPRVSAEARARMETPPNVGA